MTYTFLIMKSLIRMQKYKNTNKTKESCENFSDETSACSIKVADLHIWAAESSARWKAKDVARGVRCAKIHFRCTPLLNVMSSIKIVFKHQNGKISQEKKNVVNIESEQSCRTLFICPTKWSLSVAVNFLRKN